jgi:hypothetical protein
VLFVQPQLDILVLHIPPGITAAASLILTADSLVTVRFLTETGDITFTVRRWA